MPCIYRLEYVDPMSARATYKWLDNWYTSGHRGPSVSTEWIRAMEEVPQSPPMPHCKLMRAPLFPPHLARENHIYKLRRGAMLPDILCVANRMIVSQAAKEVIEACDDFEHEFNETEIQDEQRQRINQQPYFTLSIRRFLEIEPFDGSAMPTTNFDFSKPAEEPMLRAMANCPELMAQAAMLPFWRLPFNRSVVYLSEEALGKLRAAGLTGLKDLSTKYGEPGEAVGRFCCE